MRHLIIILFFICIGLYSFSQESQHVIVIHGGAGNFNSDDFSEQEFQDYYSDLNKVVLLGDSLLLAGYSALEVVEKCVVLLEDSPIFNAGKGSVLNSDGNPELDASVMCGKTLNAGAVSGVSVVRNPIKLAMRVMLNTPHVMLSSYGAELFAKETNLELVERDYFITDRMLKRYKSLKKEDMGTVGAVALDIEGNLAAATSTGGMMMKKYGRVGDSPIIGSGTYADNKTAAVSCTGHGEYFIRTVAAYKVTALMEFAGLSLDVATSKVIDDISDMEAQGGIIALDKDGNIAITFSTKSMFRAYKKSDGEKQVLF